MGQTKDKQGKGPVTRRTWHGHGSTRRALYIIYRANVSEPLTYGGWARVLGLESRQGADAWLRRMQSQGNLRLEKVDRGIKAIITQQAKDALKAMPPSSKKLGR